MGRTAQHFALMSVGAFEGHALKIARLGSLAIV